MDIKTYQVQRVVNKKNYRRIESQLKKLPFVELARIDKTKGILHLELKEKPVGFEESILKVINRYEKKAIITEDISQELYRKVLFLKDLDCAHCADKIEKEAKNTFNYEKLTVDFATSRFIIETKDKELFDNINDEVKKIVKKIDPHAEVMDQEEGKRILQEEESLNIGTKGIILFIAGFALVVLAEVFRLTFKDSIFNDNKLIFFFIYLISFGLVGYPVIIKSVKNLFSGQIFDENFLMTIAGIAAFTISYYEEAVFIMIFYQIGDLLQSRAVNHSRRSIQELLSIESRNANVIINGEITPVDVDGVLVGDIIVVKTGEIIPLDGTIQSGKTYLDTKAITGESKYTSVKTGDTVYSGSINMGPVIEVSVTKIHRESTVSKILDLVENANSSKSKTEKFITRFARYYTPIVVALAFFIGLIWPIIYHFVFGKDVNFTNSVHTAMVFLVISCPCALVISIPLGFFGGIGSASKQGILVKGSNYLEALHNVETVVFDKTGTLTKGEFGITEVEAIASTTTPEEIKQLIAYAEYYSSHPIGMSIVENFGKDNIFKEIIEDFSEYSGRGVRATINGDRILVGNARLMTENKIDFIPVEKPGVVSYVARNKVYLGYAVIGDKIREEAAAVIQKLRKQGINKVALLTGDNKTVGDYVANALDIDIVYSDLLPDQKVEKFNELIEKDEKKRGRTIYVGDGVNDAPVISKADVGIAMGATGSDAAIALADVVIMSDNLEKINTAIDIARFTRRVVTQNIVFSIAVKVIFLLVSLIGSITTWQAIFADVGVSLIAILNASRIIRRYRIKNQKEKLGISSNTEE